jgi:predicted ArsR family transcriptional regulator
MNTLRIKQLNWQQMQAQLTGNRKTIWEAMVRLKLATTRQIADATGISLLTVRPRVSELVELGFAECAGKETRKTTGRTVTDGIYKARTIAQVEGAWLHLNTGQLELI